MKKILFLLLGALGVALPAGAAEQKIEMVTYFPVPYVAYSHIKPTKQLDVGTATACEMNLGCDESGTVGSFPLYVTNTLNLNKGRMDFNSAAAVYSSVIKMGDGYGAANLDFNQNLRIGTLNNGYTLETDQTTVDVLNLFPDQIKNSFPSCAAVGGTDSISWQKLKLNKAEETYLVCGNATELPCDGSKKQACLYPPNEGVPITDDKGVTTETKRGFWDLATCECTCPSLYFLSDSGSCVRMSLEAAWGNCPGKQKEFEACMSASSTSAPYDDILHVRGFWNRETCTCTCPKDSAFSPDVGCIPYRVNFDGTGGGMKTVVGGGSTGGSTGGITIRPGGSLVGGDGTGLVQPGGTLVGGGTGTGTGIGTGTATGTGTGTVNTGIVAQPIGGGTGLKPVTPTIDISK